MTKRREKNKPQQASLNKQLDPAVVKPKEKSDTLVEVGKYCLDLSKLVFGGVILVILMDFGTDKQWPLFLGISGMVALFVLGSLIIKYGNIKR